MKKYIILGLILSITHYNLFSSGQEAPTATENKDKIKLLELEQKVKDLSNAVLGERDWRLRNENAAWRNGTERDAAKLL